MLEVWPTPNDGVQVDPQDIESGTAYHEAGHAVVHLRLGWKLTRVTIVPGDGYEGRTQVALPDEWTGLFQQELGMASILRIGSERNANFSATLRTARRLRRDVPGAWRGFMALLEAMVMTAIAGLTAQTMISDRIVLAAYGSRGDLKRAWDMTRVLTDNDIREAKLMTLRIEAKTRVMLNQCWSAVAAVANALQEQKDLDGDEATAVIVRTLELNGVA